MTHNFKINNWVRIMDDVPINKYIYTKPNTIWQIIGVRSDVVMVRPLNDFIDEIWWIKKKDIVPHKIGKLEKALYDV